MSGAGAYRDRVTFMERGPDINGDPLGDFLDRFLRVPANVEFQRGSESALNNRLIGLLPATVTVRDSSESRQVTEGWAFRLETGPRAGTVFDIKSPPAPGRDPRTLNMAAMAGGAPG